MNSDFYPELHPANMTYGLLKGVARVRPRRAGHGGWTFADNGRADRAADRKRRDEEAKLAVLLVRNSACASGVAWSSSNSAGTNQATVYDATGARTGRLRSAGRCAA